ncbi:class I SAM-dependent methyltransferase [Micromonospora arborensis]|uniref:class I SAM-dependent methyltransferase n=1 Tax=Micromonospora arborensis TaxID=2116518 RepID=UPI00371E2ED2
MSASTGYATRAGTYAAEVAAGLAAPQLLGDLLRPGMVVAEVPSGAGHYVGAYAEAGCRTVLVDASAEMLTASADNTTGLPDVRFVHARLESLGAHELLVDLAVMPNGALNQLTHDLPLSDVFRSLAGVLAPGGRVLVQALLGEPVEKCGFYEPLRGSSWFTDRRIPDAAGGTLVRRRRQRRHGDLVDVDFMLRRDGVLVYEHTVALRLLDRTSVTEAAALAGLTVATYRPGLGQLTEVVLAGAPS